MKKMTIRKMLENIVVKTASLDVKKFYLVSTGGEVVMADFAVDLICKVATWNVLWEVEIVAAKHYLSLLQPGQAGYYVQAPGPGAHHRQAGAGKNASAKWGN